MLCILSSSCRVLERGERIELLAHQTEELRNHAQMFQKQGKALRSNMWWQNMRMKIIVVLVVLLLVVVIFLLACFAGAVTAQHSLCAPATSLLLTTGLNTCYESAAACRTCINHCSFMQALCNLHCVGCFGGTCVAFACVCACRTNQVHQEAQPCTTVDNNLMQYSMLLGYCSSWSTGERLQLAP
jgi:uncharacterized membrane protein